MVLVCIIIICTPAIAQVQLRGRRRGGLTPALAPRIPVMTEDVRTPIEAANATAATVLPGVGCIKKMSRLSEEKKALESDSMNQQQTQLRACP